MSRTITRLFNSHTEAMAAVTELEAAGFDHDDISIIASNADNWHDGHRHGRGEGDGNETAEGAGKGATTGGLIGGAGGLLAGLGMLAIPGLGPVVAAGWLAALAAGMVAGAACGAAAGGVVGALMESGVSEHHATIFVEGIRKGGTLLTVRIDEAFAEEVRSILDFHGPIDHEAKADEPTLAERDGFLPDPALRDSGLDDRAPPRVL